MKRLDIWILLFLTVFAAVLSLHIGLQTYDPTTVWQALINPNESGESLIILGLRLPRTLVALCVGSALATSGLLMQAIFRNPLADPGLLGVNAGASLAVVAGFAFLGISALWALSLLALLGAIFAMSAIFALVVATRGSLTPITLVISGVTLAAFLSSLTQVLVVIDEGTMEALLFWLAGGFVDRDSQILWSFGPILILGVVSAGFSLNALDAMATGDFTAKALGVNVLQMRLLVAGLASALTAISVVIAGPVGFVGLIAPHIGRMIIGTNHTALLPCVALIGALLAVVADIGARLIVAPQEAPITAMLAVFGAPVLIAVVRSKNLRVVL